MKRGKDLGSHAQTCCHRDHSIHPSMDMNVHHCSRVHDKNPNAKQGVWYDVIHKLNFDPNSFHCYRSGFSSHVPIGVAAMMIQN